MTIAKILVPVCGEDSDAAALRTAVAAARPFASHVALFAIQQDPALAVPLVGVPLTPDAIAAIIDGQTRHADAAATRARATMRAVCADAGIAIVRKPERAGAPTCSFRQDWGDVASGIAAEAALSDLVVLGPICWSAREAFNAAFLDVLREVRRPLLVAHAEPRPPSRIAIGWDGSAAAAHAVSGAMPFLERARRVTILTVASRGYPAAPTAELEAYLIRHGVAAEHRTIDGGSAAAGGVLLAEAARLEADMLVAGAYGHDHLREALFGGTTETLAGGRVMPVLLAH